jgi:hypothetical protein
MTGIKSITSIFFCALFLVACTSSENSEHINPFKTSINWAALIDTSKEFSATTQILGSNRIPDSVFEMTLLEHLSISGMDCDFGDSVNCWMIKDIPPEIRKLKNLKTLGLTLNAITTIPEQIVELSNLTQIDLTDNAGLTNVDMLTKLPKLQYLYLYGCGLTRLPEDLSGFNKLRELGLVGNRIDIREQNRIKKALPNCNIKF